MAIDPNKTFHLPQKRPSRLFGQYIIKNHFQFKFSLILFGLLAGATLLLWFESKFVVNNLINTGVVTNEDAIEQLKILSSVIGKSGFVVMAITFGITLFLSHFIAGPIYRLEKSFQEMGTGNISLQIKLRKHDELKDVANEFNIALAGLRNKVKKEREASAALVEAAQKLVAQLKQGGHTAEADALQHALTEFKNQPLQIKVS